MRNHTFAAGAALQFRNGAVARRSTAQIKANGNCNVEDNKVCGFNVSCKLYKNVVQPNTPSAEKLNRQGTFEADSHAVSPTPIEADSKGLQPKPVEASQDIDEEHASEQGLQADHDAITHSTNEALKDTQKETANEDRLKVECSVIEDLPVTPTYATAPDDEITLPRSPQAHTSRLGSPELHFEELGGMVSAAHMSRSVGSMDPLEKQRHGIDLESDQLAGRSGAIP
ncbi:MAG: hypothetical protein M1828_007342 [Chrysothrix sp. TS-e1954]|nr:MAG: hypothetical protein M1828_007342 [Chrysothrix sp. TS-e1954]